MPTRGIRPRSLREAVALGGRDYQLRLDEMLDEFYLTYPNKDIMQSMIDEPPPLTGDFAADAFIAAVGEHLAIRWSLQIPEWVDEKERLGGPRPQFVPDLPKLRPILLVESPYAFRRRNIFVGPEPLQRARWPRGVAVYEPIGGSHDAKIANEPF